MARLLQADTVVNEVPLRYAGRTSTFVGRLPLEAAGSFELEVLAMDPAHANFALYRRSLTIAP